MQIKTEIRGLERIRAKVRRMSPAVREEVGRATERNAGDLLTDIKRAVPTRTRALRRSARVSALRGSRRTGFKTVSGDRDAFYARMVEFGTKAGRREIKRGPRKGQSFDHPGTAPTGYHVGRYLTQRAIYRRRMRQAYKRAAQRS